jgi:hypothetical protein
MHHPICVAHRRFWRTLLAQRLRECSNQRHRYIVSHFKCFECIRHSELARL